MLSFTNETLGRLNEERVSKFHDRLGHWLLSRNVGWDDLAPDVQKIFLAENDVRGRRYGVHAEKSRGLLALSYMLCGDVEAFEAREDVAEVLTDERVHEYGKVRRLHAIAFEISTGIKPEPSRSPLERDDATFALPKTNERPG